MTDERVIERWMRLEMGEIQRALVVAPRPLHELLSSKEPSVATRAGGAHRMDPAVLRNFAATLSPLARAVVRLPILFYADREAPGSCFISDDGQAQALRELNVLKSEPREGRYWISEPLAREFHRAYPGLAQFVLL